MIKFIAAGLLAGLVAGILYLAAGNGSWLSLVLFYAAPLPLAIAGFVWFWPASIASIIAGAIVVLVAADLRSATVFSLSFSIPIAWFCHKILLYRENAEDGNLVKTWYPLGNVITAVALMAAALVMVGVFTISGSMESYQAFVESNFQNFSELSDLQRDGLEIDEALYQQFLDQLAYLLPILLASGWIMITLVNLYGGAKIAVLSGQLTRPWEDLSALSLPSKYSVAMVPALIGTMLPGLIGLACLVLLGTMAIAHAIVGLAVLHAVTRHFPGRPVLLAIAYGAVLLLGFPLIALTILGLMEPWAKLRLKISGGRLSGPGNT